MTLAELLHRISWPDLQAALLWCYPHERNSLEGYRILHGKLKRFDPQPSSMRIIVREADRPDCGGERYIEVVGRNGEWNRDQRDFERSRKNAEPGWGDQETEFALSLERWDEWLGMSIDPATLASVPLPEIAAHCMSEMTFYGFDEADVQAVVDEIKARVAELDAMTPEEREKILVPHEEVMKRLESKLEKE